MNYQQIKTRLEARALILKTIDIKRQLSGNEHLFRAAEFQMLKSEYEDLMRATAQAEVEA